MICEIVFCLIAVFMLIWFLTFMNVLEGYIERPDPECNSVNNVFYPYPNTQYYTGPLQRNALDFPSYPFPMNDKYSFGRTFYSDPSPISYKPGYW